MNIPENRLTFNIGDAKVTLRPMDYLSNAHDVSLTLCGVTSTKFVNNKSEYATIT